MAESVLVTGASSGIGAATAKRLADAGFRVFGTSRRPAAQPAGGPITWIGMDVQDEASVRKGVEEVLAGAGRLDALVCNAGSGIFGSVEETPLEKAIEQLDVNFFGVVRTLRAVLPHMRGAGRGRIVLVGSLAGRAPIPFQAHYSASKAAVDALAQALRSELHGRGVHVSLVEPGDVDTAFNDHVDFGAAETSAYGDAIARCARVVRESLPKAPGPEIVAEAVHRALTDRPPRVRYPVGPESRLLPIGRRLLPERLLLHLVRRHFGL